MTDHPVKTLYFDTSYLYRIDSAEPGHNAVMALLMETEEVVSAWHARAEFASILLRKRREGKDTPAFLDSLSAQFHQDQREGLLRFLALSEPVMLRCLSVLRRRRPRAETQRRRDSWGRGKKKEARRKRGGGERGQGIWRRNQLSTVSASGAVESWRAPRS